MFPHVMAEVEYLVSVSVGFCDVEVAVNQRYQKRIKNVIQKLVEDFVTFSVVCFARFLALDDPRGLKPLYVIHL